MLGGPGKLFSPRHCSHVCSCLCSWPFVRLPPGPGRQEAAFTLVYCRVRCVRDLQVQLPSKEEPEREKVQHENSARCWTSSCNTSALRLRFQRCYAAGMWRARRIHHSSRPRAHRMLGILCAGPLRGLVKLVMPPLWCSSFLCAKRTGVGANRGSSLIAQGMFGSMSESLVSGQKITRESAPLASALHRQKYSKEAPVATGGHISPDTGLSESKPGRAATTFGRHRCRLSRFRKRSCSTWQPVRLPGAGRTTPGVPPAETDAGASRPF